MYVCLKAGIAKVIIVLSIYTSDLERLERTQPRVSPCNSFSLSSGVLGIREGECTYASPGCCVVYFDARDSYEKWQLAILHHYSTT